MGPVAGLPSVRTCMICHNTIATDRPRIQQITAMREQGIDLAWQRVYGYPAPAHVKFNHAPHIRAQVECATCHGNIAEQTVAERNVDLSMGFCVTCHNENKASVECLTCHY